MSRPRQDPTEWARKMQEAKDRAAQIKAARSGGGMSEPADRPTASSGSARPASFSARSERRDSYSGGGDAYGGPADGGFGPLGGAVPPPSRAQFQASESSVYAPAGARQYGPGAVSSAPPRSAARGAPADPAYGYGPDASAPSHGAADHGGYETGGYPRGGTHAAPPVGASGRPGYRGMVSFGDDGGSRTSLSGSSAYGGRAPATGSEPYEYEAEDRGRAVAPATHHHTGGMPYSGPATGGVSYGKPQMQADAEETFQGLLRSDEPVGKGRLPVAGRRKARPEWSSEYAAPEVAAASEAGMEADALPPTSTAARLARMRAEMGSKSAQVDSKTARGYAGIVEATPSPATASVKGSGYAQPGAEYGRRAGGSFGSAGGGGGGGGSGGGGWDDEPLGGRSVRSNAAPAWDDSPVGGGEGTGGGGYSGPKGAGATAGATRGRPSASASASRGGGGGRAEGGGRAPPAAAHNFDDMPVGRSTGGGGVPSFDDMPVGGGSKGQANQWNDEGYGGGGMSEYPEPSSSASGRPTSTPAASKLSLLKSKIRSGSARSASFRSNPTPTSEGSHYGGGEETEDNGFSPPPARVQQQRPAPTRAHAPAASAARRPAPTPPVYQDARYEDEEEEEEEAADHDNKPIGRAAASNRAAAGMDGEQPPEDLELVECGGCGRKFTAPALAKHAKICAKVFQTKRKAYNSKAHALPEEALALAAGKSHEGKGGKGKPPRPGAAAAAAAVAVAERALDVDASKPKNKWESKSNELRNAMKAAREYKAALAAGIDLPPPVASAPDPSLVPCPHCGRNFSDKAAERHIPKCATTRAKPSFLSKGSGHSALTPGAATGTTRAGAVQLSSTTGNSNARGHAAAAAAPSARNHHQFEPASSYGSGRFEASPSNGYSDDLYAMPTHAPQPSRPSVGIRDAGRLGRTAAPAADYRGDRGGVDPHRDMRASGYEREPMRGEMRIPPSSALRSSGASNVPPPTSYGYAADLLAEPPPSKASLSHPRGPGSGMPTIARSGSGSTGGFSATGSSGGGGGVAMGGGRPSVGPRSNSLSRTSSGYGR